MRHLPSIVPAAAVLAGAAPFAAAQDGETTVGPVMGLPGPADAWGQAGAKSVGMAFVTSTRLPARWAAPSPPTPAPAGARAASPWTRRTSS